MKDFRVALCQMRPGLGTLDENLAEHHAWLDRAEEAGAELAVFPELSLTGYFLRDLTQDVALRLDDARVRELVARTAGRSAVFGLVEEDADHRFYNSAVFAEDGEILHVHRKVHLPDYGIFEEGRYFAEGDGFVPVESRLGRFGILLCEDAWHLSAGWLHFVQGVDALLVPSASPARGVDVREDELSSQAAWRSLLTAQSRFFQTWTVHVNRVGVEEGVPFWGASSVFGPFGYPAGEAASEEEELLVQALDDEALRRARVQSPMLRDARPHLVRAHLARILDDPDARRAAEESAARRGTEES